MADRRVVAARTAEGVRLAQPVHPALHTPPRKSLSARWRLFFEESAVPSSCTGVAKSCSRLALNQRLSAASTPVSLSITVLPIDFDHG
jgi:hypothetical protein